MSDAPAMLENYADYISVHARETPNKQAVSDRTTQLTYAELEHAVTAVALRLRGLGIAVGELVGVSLPDTVDHVCVLLGMSRLGAVIVPMDHRWLPSEKQAIAAQFEVARVLTAPGDAPIPGVTCIAVTPDWKFGPAHADEFPHDRNMPMLLSMSSGTTGRPKGPMSSQAAQIRRSVDGVIQPSDVVLTATPLYFGGGRGFALGGLLKGASVILFTPPFRSEELITLMQERGVTYTFLVPTQTRRLLARPDDGKLLFPKLRILVSSGAVLHAHERAEIMRRISPNLLNMYASTESGGIAGLRPSDPPEKQASVGRPSAGVQVQIVDATDTPLPAGEIGRIRVRGPTVPDGFYKNPDETARYFIDGWYYTGDLGHFDSDGYLYLAGRSKEMIIRGGINIYPGEIEEALLTLAEVHDCAAVPWPSPMLGEEVALFVVREGEIDEQGILDACRARMAPYKIPRAVFFIDELPKNSHGKVVRGQLAALLPKLD